MTLQYDPPDEAYTTTVPKGVAAFRSTAPAHFGFPWTEVVRDKDRCQPASKSEHCVCRGLDSFENKQYAVVPVVKGRKFFEWCVKNADALGIQAVIFNRRVWGFGTWSERHYTGRSDHTDHVHLGFNKVGARYLTKAIVQSLLPGAPQGGFLMALSDEQQANLYQWMSDTRNGVAALNAKADELLARSTGPDEVAITQADRDALFADLAARLKD